MFSRPTKRSQTNPKPKKFFFTDAPLPNGTRAQPADPPEEPGGVGGETYFTQGGKRQVIGYRINAGDDKVPITVQETDQAPTVPSQRQNDLSEPRPTLRYPATAESGKAGSSPNAKPTGDDPDTISPLGGIQPVGMMPELMGRYPVEGVRFIYWCETTPNGFMVYKREVDGSSTPATQIAAFPRSPDTYYWYDQTTTHFRVWRIGADQTELDRPGLMEGRKAAAAVGDGVRKLKAINAANAAKWR